MSAIHCAWLCALMSLALGMGGSSGSPQEHGGGDQEPVSTDDLTWPKAPRVRLSWDPRGPQEVFDFDFEAAEGDWVRGAGRRHARLVRRVDDVAFLVWLEQFEGVAATRVTVAAINGFAFAGPRYFERYAIEIDGKEREDIRGQHVILPRGALLRRYFTGAQQEELREWRYVHDPRPVPSWADQAARKDTAKQTAFPFRDAGGRPIDLGPYNFFWANKSLDDSHGGWGVGPFHGGPDDWLTCAAGRQNREAEMLLDFQRPIWMLADDFSPLRLEVAYWMGRTALHEPAEFQYELDDWCPYAATLAQYRFADYTHLSRGPAGAAAVAAWDVFAVECLRAVLTDFKTAQSLTRVVGQDADGNDLLHPGALQDNPLLFPLWKKIETVHGPHSSGGDRGLAHWLRLLRWCRPYFPREELEPWEEGLRALVRGLADENGLTTAGNAPGWVSQAGGLLTKPLEPPFVKTFHQQLVAYECLRFGGLEDIGRKCVRFLTAHPPAYFELRPSKPTPAGEGVTRETVRDRNHSADDDQKDKHWAYEAYGNMTHNVLIGFESASRFLATMSTRGVNGGSQDLDCTPRQVWEPGAR
jgi:hypothetical protein